jgi:hypothetical protein
MASGAVAGSAVPVAGVCVAVMAAMQGCLSWVAASWDSSAGQIAAASQSDRLHPGQRQHIVAMIFQSTAATH